MTVALTDDQVTRSQQGQSLWLQGGAVDDPVLDQLYPGQYGFAALRCAVDNLNGDNVEYIAYPNGATHVLCYAYYVEPPPTSGTIVVNKVVDDPAVTTRQDFSFFGNLSYNENNRFTLSAANGQPASETFYRAAGAVPWVFSEEALPGWSLTGLACTSANKTSTIITSLATGVSSVTLAASDTVTCTYTNRPTPPSAGLQLSKRTLGGVGSFTFAVAGEDSGSQTITTTEPGVPVAGAPVKGAPGEYTISERLPARTPAGRWSRVAVTCGGRHFNPLKPVTLTLTGGEGVACEFTNRYIPAGALRIRKSTIGGVGTAHFRITPRRGVPREYLKSATVSRQVIPVTATGDSTNQLPLGTYDILEFGRRQTEQGRWQLASVLCDGRPVPNAQGRTQVRLTRSNPRVSCLFVNRLVPDPTPTPTPTPTPSPTPVPPLPTPVPTVSPSPSPPPPTPVPPDGGVLPADGPVANLVVTKSVTPSNARSGQRVRYTITIVNRGPDTASDVVATEVNPRNLRRLRISTTRGRCVGIRPARCDIGTLAPGQRAVITVDTIAGAPGRNVNQVAVASATDDSDLSDNVADAALIVRRPTAPRVTG